MLIVNNVVNFLVNINAAVNFILYSCMSGKFRRTFAHLLYTLRYRVWRAAGGRGGDGAAGGAGVAGGGAYAQPFSVSGAGLPPGIGKHRGSYVPPPAVTLRNRSTATTATANTKNSAEDKSSGYKHGRRAGKDSPGTSRDRLTLLTPLGDDSPDITSATAATTTASTPTTPTATATATTIGAGKANGSRVNGHSVPRFVITVMAPSPEEDRLLSREVIRGVSSKPLAKPHSTPFAISSTMG